ncbi:MAG: type III pantothenate kinase [Thiobacillaceae bacterium]|nr:type III pantothenate kinase [Thiobacillaceae bacterium]
MREPGLFVDVGNTRLKWGVWAQGAWRRKGHLPVADARGIEQSLAGVRPGCTWVSCVAGAAVRAELAAALSALGGEVRWLTPSIQAYGLRLEYDEVTRFGADRYAMLVACVHRRFAPCVVVGAGTAVTVDAVDAAGEFLGGLILPGPRLMRQALVSATAGVRSVAGRLRDFPRSTGDAVESGIWRALAGAVEDMRLRLEGVVGTRPAVVVSGGEAQALARCLAAPRRVVVDLVLEGLLCIARMQAEGRQTCA